MKKIPITSAVRSALLSLIFIPAAHAASPAPDITELSRAADAGDSNALFVLATDYLHGRYVEKDYYRGEHLLQAAARAGNTKAMMLMANMYFYGQSHFGNQEDAFHEVLHAARLGSPQAMTALAVMYWLGGAAQADAQHGLSGILPVNHHHARQWITLARMHAQTKAGKESIIKLQAIFTGGMSINALKALAADVSRQDPKGEIADWAAADYRQFHTIPPPPEDFFPMKSAHDGR